MCFWVPNFQTRQPRACFRLGGEAFPSWREAKERVQARAVQKGLPETLESGASKGKGFFQVTCKCTFTCISVGIRIYMCMCMRMYTYM